jgi:hypothetical protein
MRTEDAAQAAYDRLMAARRTVTPEEREQRREDSARQELRARIRRKLPKVY